MPYSPPTLQATNVPSNPNVAGTVPTAAASAQRITAISSARAADANIDANAGTMQQADAQRAMPRARTDNLNEASGRHLTPAGETIEPPSIYSHRMNRRNANKAAARLNDAQSRVVSGFVNPQTNADRQIRAGINSHFESGGSVNDLPPALRRLVRQYDGAIQKAERENDRNHVVYTKLQVPNNDMNAFVRGLENNPGHRQNLLGYTRADHDLNKIDDGNDNSVYVQIETARGMYVGNEGNSKHLLPRGLELEFAGVSEFNVDDGQGGTKRRRVVQMREVRQNERTTART